MAASVSAGSSAPAASSAATSVSIGSVADGSDSREREKSQAKTQEDQKKKNPRKVLKRKDYLCRVLQSWSPLSGGCWCCPLPENPPLPETSPLPKSLPLPESSPLSGDSPLALGGAALLLHKPAVGYQQRQSIHIGKQTIYLRWGLLWRKVVGSGKVVSGAPPAVAVGSSSMTITRTLALFAALWARVLKRNEFRVRQIRYKTKTAKIEGLQIQQGDLTLLLCRRS